MEIGVFQSAGAGLTPAERVERLAEAIRGRGLDLVLCPELFASGYNVGDALRRYAEPAGGPVFESIAHLAARETCAVVYGYPERGAGGVLYNSAAVVSPDGRLLANHRKRLNAPHGFEAEYFTGGDGQTLFTYLGITIAILICYEAEIPEAARAAALGGAALILVPTALARQWPDVACKLIPTRAFENGVWLAYANHAGSENGLDYLGASRIVGPEGRDEAVAGAGEELITARIIAARVTAAQARLPYLRDAPRLPLGASTQPALARTQGDD